MRSRPHRTPYAALLAATAGVVLAGCGDAGGVKSAGPTSTATGPVRLWPELPPVTSPPFDYGEVDTAPVPGVKVPARGVRGLDPVDVLRAEKGTAPHEHSEIYGIYQETVEKLDDCDRKLKSCPVLTPYHHDLTGDGREELIVAVTMPDQQTAVRCYTPGKDGRLTRVMATSDQLVGVELAGRDLVLRSVSAGIPGYEYRTTWSWDGRHRAMLSTSDEIVRVAPRASGLPPRAETAEGPVDDSADRAVADQPAGRAADESAGQP